MSTGLRDSLIDRLASAIEIDTHGIGDTWPIFNDASLFSEVVTALADPYRDDKVSKVVGVEARGFALGAAVARELNAGFVGIRKPGGLCPGDAHEHRTPPDYRGNEFVLRLQAKSLDSNDRVLLVDDWFETGGQAITAVQLIQRTKATYLGASIIVDWLRHDMRLQLKRVHGLLDLASLPNPAAGAVS